MAPKKLRKKPSRSWSIPEPRGWQQSSEFFKEYPTRKTRKAFYEARRDFHRKIWEKLRDGSLPSISAAGLAISSAFTGSEKTFFGYPPRRGL